MDISPILKEKPKIQQKKRRGKRKKRSQVKELLMLLVIDLEGTIGRYRLKDILALSEHEGIVRQMLLELKNNNYISINKSGCLLTHKGKSFLKNYLQSHNIVEIQMFDSPLLKAGDVSIGMHLHNMADKFDSAMQARDIAIRGGATGATLITVHDNLLHIPSVNYDFFSVHPNLARKIHNSFKLKNNDIIFVISAKDKWRAFEASIILANTLSQ